MAIILTLLRNTWAKNEWMLFWPRQKYANIVSGLLIWMETSAKHCSVWYRNQDQHIFVKLCDLFAENERKFLEDENRKLQTELQKVKMSW